MDRLVKRLPALILVAISIRAASAAEPVDYLRDVKPILRERCFACHGALKQEAGLRLDTAALVIQGGENGSVVEAGNAAASPLIARVSDPDETTRMPQEGEALSAEDIAVLAAWIDGGAAGPADELPEEDPRRHWAFIAPVRPVVPSVQNAAWVRNPVDAFLAAEHERHALVANPPAEKHTLLRRVHLDLVGLPPTREELRAFLADESPDAYEKVVERLLASLHYGERWGRHWMDVWRYSDWYGRRAVPDVMNSYPMMWRWRDWIVRSLNEDKGYDRMIVEMLAADEAAPEDDANLVATGFVARNWYKWNYNTWMKDAVEHTGKAFLGLTLNCCHCHDHKYDPITQEEYFRFRAFFEPLELRHDRVPGEPDPGPFQKYVYAQSYGPIASGMVRVFDEKLDAETYMYSKGDARNRIEGRGPVPPGAPAALGGEGLAVEPVELAATAWYPGLKSFIQQEELARRQAAIGPAEAALAAARTTWESSQAAPDAAAREAEARLAVTAAEAALAAAQAEVESVMARIAADNARYIARDASAEGLIQRAVQAEHEAALAAAQSAFAAAEQALAAAQAEPPETEGREAKTQAAQQQLAASGAAVEAARAALAGPPADYTPLSPQYPRTSTGRRLALARWIVDRQNPLAARVAVNHVWLRHFGRPLVETTFDFGRNGKRPSHLELLDWLAVEFMDHGWSMKHLHRLIVTSNAYRMRSGASGIGDPRLAIDPDNRWLWQANFGRMEAEVVRDSLLAVAGELDLTPGGPEIDHAQGLVSKRRSLYFAHHGESKMEFLELFDGADACDCYRRTTSVQPQQALALTNSELSLNLGRVLAGKLWHEVEQAGPPDEDRLAMFVRAAFEQVLSRSPSQEELAVSTTFLARQTELFQAADPARLNNQADGGVPPSSDPAQRARENMVHALLGHNDFVTIR
jgi:hypothetical protein